MARSPAWFIVGQFSFGLVIGVMVGLSFSPIVGSVISLLFAFIGGSILVLIKGKSNDELAVIGMSVTSLSVAMIIGALSGIYMRVGPPGTPEFARPSTRTIDQPLSIDEIARYGAQEEYAEVVCEVIQSSADSDNPISKSDIVALMENKVDRKVILALLDSDFECREAPVAPAKAESGSKDKKAAASGFGLYTDKIREKLFGSDDPLPNRIATE